MILTDELGDERTADGSAGSCDKDSHVDLLGAITKKGRARMLALGLLEKP
jgi:hypothetical protein